jgi:hypothetical protein
MSVNLLSWGVEIALVILISFLIAKSVHSGLTAWLRRSGRQPELSAIIAQPGKTRSVPSAAKPRSPGAGARPPPSRNPGRFLITPQQGYSFPGVVNRYDHTFGGNTR